MAPRSVFNATITFGLVNVPVKLHTATQSQSISFREVHLADGAPIEHRRINPKSGKEVDYDDVVKGYEVAKGEYVTLTKEEVDAAAGENAKLIEIEDFVEAGEIDPIFYEKTYFLGAREEAEDAYALLREALKKSDRVGIGRMVFRNREYLVAVRALTDKVLALHTMRFADEIVDPGDIEVPSPSKGPSKREVDMAGKLVDQLTEAFDAESFSDSYREAVLDVIARKAAGKNIEPPEDEPEPERGDLVSALEASLKGGR